MVAGRSSPVALSRLRKLCGKRYKSALDSQWTCGGRFGLSRSEAIRRAILDGAGRLRERAALAAEVAALEADENDRREMLEVASFMESLRAER